MIGIQLAVLLLVAVTGTAVVFTREPINQAIGLSLFGLILAVMFLVAFAQVPGPDAQRNRYSHAINTRVVAERNITDAVTGVNFDYRGFDTVGEEFILFVSVIGSLVLLREATEKKEEPVVDAISRGRDVPTSDAVRLWTLLMVAPNVLFGLYMVTHGQLSPGGGFQGGVVLATAALVIYLGENFRVFERIVSHPLTEIAEAAGAGLFVLIGIMALFRGREFLSNFLPLGKLHQLTSGGTIPLISFFTGVEVTGGFVILLYAFLQETLTSDKD